MGRKESNHIYTFPEILGPPLVPPLDLPIILLRYKEPYLQEACSATSVHSGAYWSFCSAFANIGRVREYFY